MLETSVRLHSNSDDRESTSSIKMEFPPSSLPFTICTGVHHRRSSFFPKFKKWIFGPNF